MATPPPAHYSVALISTTFHTDHMPRMNEAAIAHCRDNGLDVLMEFHVPGCLEAPLALHNALLDDRISGAIVLGIIERGETEHGSTIGHAVTQSIVDLQIQHRKPVGMGIIGPGVFPSQIEPRVEGYGRAAAAALCRMLELFPPNAEPLAPEATGRI